MEENMNREGLDSPPLDDYAFNFGDLSAIGVGNLDPDVFFDEPIKEKKPAIVKKYGKGNELKMNSDCHACPSMIFKSNDLGDDHDATTISTNLDSEETTTRKLTIIIKDNGRELRRVTMMLKPDRDLIAYSNAPSKKAKLDSTSISSPAADEHVTLMTKKIDKESKSTPQHPHMQQEKLLSRPVMNTSDHCKGYCANKVLKNQEEKDHAQRLDATKRKLQESNERINKSKKQRMTKLIEIQRLPATSKRDQKPIKDVQVVVQKKKLLHRPEMIKPDLHKEGEVKIFKSAADENVLSCNETQPTVVKRKIPQAPPMKPEKKVLSRLEVIRSDHHQGCLTKKVLPKPVAYSNAFACEKAQLDNGKAATTSCPAADEHLTLSNKTQKLEPSRIREAQPPPMKREKLHSRPDIISPDHCQGYCTKKVLTKEEEKDHALKLDAAKRKVRESYEQNNNYKKRRSIQLIELEDLPPMSKPIIQKQKPKAKPKTLAVRNTWSSR